MMKIQELGIIFIIIMLPISIVLSAYTQFQVQTLNTQTLYDTKLTTATFDAIKAFQLNTANSTLEDISDSKIRDIEASVKTFKNSMISTFRLNGYTEEDLNNFIPALVYTMYDGFYIYSPYVNTIDEVGEPVSGNGTTMYGLKPYISYSCRYTHGGTDVVITYSLDNYITIQGTVNSEYVNKSGYLIDNIENVSGAIYYNGIKIDDSEAMEEYVPIPDNNGNFDLSNQYTKCKYVKYNGTKYYYDPNDADQQVFYYSNGTFTQYGKNTDENRAFLNLYIKKNDSNTANIPIESFGGGINYVEYPYVRENGKDYFYDSSAYSFFWYENGRKYQYRGNKSYNDMVDTINNNNSAKKYYEEAKEFTEYVETNLGNLQFCDAVEYSINADGTSGSSYQIWSSDTRRIFQSGNIENKLSNFNQHRLEVIRHKIERNLSIAINNYNNFTNAQDILFQMPELKEEEWDLVMNNISLISFVQGLDIGGKIYNGYSIVNNTESKEVVQEGRIYILGEDNFYHKIGDKYLEDGNNIREDMPAGRLNLDFKRQNMIIRTTNDTIYYYPVKYDAKNSFRGSYDSIITQNNVTEYDDIYAYISNQNDKLKKAFYMAIGREREAMYKSATTSIK